MLFFAALHLVQQTVPKAGMVVNEAISWSAGEYLVADAHEDGSGAVITIKGDNLVIDFKGMVLRGTPQTTEPNERKGTGILVQGRNITIKNANVHGYKHGLIAQNSPGLRIENSDFSYNWKQLLMSTQEREDTSDWMSYHNNEGDEWLRFGTGIYLDNCDGAVIKDVTIVGGQNGLMMTETDDSKIYNNNFSFLSSLGVGMYRSSKNTIMHNNIDWCVRGHSEYVYNRGQDSAGILIYEQSNDNVFAYNSVTHGGDGFFLWAGQETMDDGQGGCNDNLLVGNDFSHAPTNGIEATFSRNGFVNNLLLECWHGIWGGYSWESITLGNVFGLNAEAIAWEHGQDNLFQDNTFYRDLNGIRLWQNNSEDPNWGYPKNRDTRSRDNVIVDNEFRHIAGAALWLTNTEDVTLRNNLFESVNQVLRADRLRNITYDRNRLFATTENLDKDQIDRSTFGTVREGAGFKSMEPTMQGSGLLVLGPPFDPELYMERFNTSWKPFGSRSFRVQLESIKNNTGGLGARLPEIPAPMADGKDPFLKPGTLRGRRYILVDQWGPYDFKYPLIWPRKMPEPLALSVNQSFEILGPKGTWKVKSVSDGVTVNETEGQVPGEISMRLPQGRAMNVEVVLEYVGGETTDYRGITRPAGQPVEFKFRKFFMPIEWNLTQWQYDLETQDPRTEYDAWKAAMNTGTKLVRKTDNLNFAWGGSPGEGITNDHFGTIAEGEFQAPAGEYDLVITSDDGVRVWLDGKLIHEDWTWHAPKTETKTVRLGGNHKVRVEHFELDGYSTLKVEIKPKG